MLGSYSDLNRGGKSEHSLPCIYAEQKWVAGNARVWWHIGASRDADAERLGFRS